MNVPKEYQYVRLDEKLYDTYEKYIKAIDDISAKLEDLGPGMVTNEDLNALRTEVLKEKRNVTNNKTNINAIDVRSKNEDQSLLKRITALNERFDTENGLQMYYYINEAPYVIQTFEQNVMVMNISTRGNTNMVCDFLFTGEASVDCELKLKLLINGKDLVYKPIFHLKKGINTIGFPYGVPKVMSGVSRIEVVITCSAGTFSIQPYNFQTTFTGSQMIGGISSQLPYAEVEENLIYAVLDVVPIPTIEDAVEVIIQLPTYAAIVDNIFYQEQEITKIQDSHYIILTDVLPFKSFEKLSCNTANLQISNNQFSIKNSTEFSIELVEYLYESTLQPGMKFHSISHNYTLNSGAIRYLISVDDDPLFYSVTVSSDGSALNTNTEYNNASTIDDINAYIRQHDDIQKIRLKFYIKYNIALKEIGINKYIGG